MTFYPHFAASKMMVHSHAIEICFHFKRMNFFLSWSLISMSQLQKSTSQQELEGSILNVSFILALLSQKLFAFSMLEIIKKRKTHTMKNSLSLWTS